MDSTSCCAPQSFIDNTYQQITNGISELGVIHMVRLKRKSQTRRKQKIAAAIYLYQVDNDGEWGEISFDFERGTAEVTALVGWDTSRTHRFANLAIQELLNCNNKALPKETWLVKEL